MTHRALRLGATLALGIALAVSLGAPAMAQDAAGDTALQVQVVASLPTASGDSSPPNGASTSTAGSSGAGATAPPSSVDPSTPAAGLDEVGVAGILFVGGLTVTPIPSANPLGGTVVASFTVRNVSSSTFDSEATFWLDGPVGNRISAVDVDVTALAPGQSRVVTADLPGSGQWGFLTAHATYTPPPVIDDVEIEPMTRDASLFALPWFSAVIAVVALGAFVIVRALRAGPARLPLGATA